MKQNIVMIALLLTVAIAFFLNKLRVAVHNRGMELQNAFFDHLRNYIRQKSEEQKQRKKE